MKLKLPTRQPEVEAEGLEQFIDLFLEHKAETTKPETHRNYVLYMYPFKAWWESWGAANGYKLSPAAFRAFDKWMGTEYVNRLGKAASDHGRHRTANLLTEFCDWLLKSGCIDAPIIGWVVDRPLKRKQQFFPDAADVERLFAYADAQDQRLQYMALFGFMFGTGVRRMELSGALIENTTFKTPVSNLCVDADHRGHTWLERTKGGDPRFVVFGQKAGLMLKCWLRCSGRTSGEIFGLADAGVAMVMKRAAMRSGVPELSCHAARRAFCDHWMDKHERDPFAYSVLKLQVGHSLNNDKDDVTSVRYINLNNSKKVLERLYAYHVSLVDDLEIDWSRWPVNIPA